MKQYLLSIYQPDGPPPAQVDLAAIMREVSAVRDEMVAAGALVFTGGLTDAGAAAVVRPSTGTPLVTDGPFIESKEHLGGFSVIRAADRTAALEWGRKLAHATTLPVEVREFR